MLQQGLNGYEGVADTYLDAWNWLDPRGQSQLLLVRQGLVRVALLRFEIPPMEEAIGKATLELWSTAIDGSGELTVRAYVLRRPWDENVANWLAADDGSPWASPGADGAGTDRDTEYIAQGKASSTGAWVSLDITRAVRRWAQDPDANYGLVLQGQMSPRVEYAFCSSQWIETARRPKLVMTPGGLLARIQTLTRSEGLGLVVALVAGVVAIALMVLVAYPLRRILRSRRGEKDVVR